MNHIVPFVLLNHVRRGLELEVEEYYQLATHRNQRIISHYQREIDRGHMGTMEGIERCLGDLRGRNYAPEYKQNKALRMY